MDLDQILRFAVKHGISDVHLKVGKPPYFRKDGVLVTQKGVPPLTGELLLQWVSQSGGRRQRDLFDQTSEADYAYALDGCGRFRVNAYRQRQQPGMVLRHIPPRIMSVEELGLPPVLKKIAMSQRGIILVTGATGSGKSTSLAAMIEHVNQQRACHILTIEDPIEFTFEDKKAMVNQREIGRDTNDWAAALRAALRQDPDVILLGELRDTVTVETALHAAETGHLVFGTLHTVDCMETISRLIGMFPPHQQLQVRLQLSTILRSVISQRLVRTSGGGRCAACEVMIHSEFIKDLIADPHRTHEIPQVIAQGQTTYGTQTFDQALYRLWKQRRITDQEALQNATNPADLKMKFEGIGNM